MPPTPLLDPEKNTTIEVGAKADVLGRPAEPHRRGVPHREDQPAHSDRPGRCNTATLVLDGLARVDGVELGVAGKLTDKWQVFAGYSYLDSEIVEDHATSPSSAASCRTRRPHNFTLWTTYDVDAGLTVGGGAVYQPTRSSTRRTRRIVPDVLEGST